MTSLVAVHHIYCSIYNWSSATKQKLLFHSSFLANLHTGVPTSRLLIDSLDSLWSSSRSAGCLINASGVHITLISGDVRAVSQLAGARDSSSASFRSWRRKGRFRNKALAGEPYAGMRMLLTSGPSAWANKTVPPGQKGSLATMILQVAHLLYDINIQTSTSLICCRSVNLQSTKLHHIDITFENLIT
jgi:hypothetical protein